MSNLRARIQVIWAQERRATSAVVSLYSLCGKLSISLLIEVLKLYCTYMCCTDLSKKHFKKLTIMVCFKANEEAIRPKSSLYFGKSIYHSWVK